MYEEDGSVVAGGATGAAVIGGAGAGAGGGLAFTGVAIAEWWLIGVAAVLVGLALVVLSRRVWRPRIQTEV